MRTLPILLGVSMLLAASAARAELFVVTTTTDLADLTRKVGGDRVKVKAICHGDQDPHFVEPRPSYMVDLSRADLLVSVGLDLEVGWLPSLLQGARNPTVNPGGRGYLDASVAVRPIEIPGRDVDRSAGDVHPRGNPHYWLDPENMKAVARLIGERLERLDPEGAPEVRARTQSYVRRLDWKIAEWKRKLAPLSGANVVSYHRTFNYFFKRFGLVGVDYIEPRPGVPPSASHLADVIRTMKRRNVRLMLHENFYDERPSRIVAGRTGARLVVLPTSVGGVRGTGSYVSLVDRIVRSLTER